MNQSFGGKNRIIIEDYSPNCEETEIDKGKQTASFFEN